MDNGVEVGSMISNGVKVGIGDGEKIGSTVDVGIGLVEVDSSIGPSTDSSVGSSVGSSAGSTSKNNKTHTISTITARMTIAFFISNFSLTKSTIFYLAKMCYHGITSSPSSLGLNDSEHQIQRFAQTRWYNH